MYYYVYLCTDNYVLMKVRWWSCMAIEVVIKSWRRLWLSFLVEPCRLSHGVCCSSCAFGPSWIVVLDLWLCLCLVYDHTTLFAKLCCYWFSWFSSCLFLVFTFYVLSVLVIVWEIGNFMELRRAVWNPTSNVRIQMKLCAWVSTTEGKTMTIDWPGWVHHGKQTMVVQTWER